jgi:geranylgeranyl pyrophosphate synthase
MSEKSNLLNWQNTTLSRVSAKIVDLLEAKRFANVDILIDSMVYSCDGSGKCIRPLLLQAAGAISSADHSVLDLLSASLEIIHSFSLVHDDLPCMDNDDYRRGKLSNHKVYGADIALLAGDALLVYAFEILSDKQILSYLDPGTVLQIINMVTKAIGVEGMVGGQALDMLYTDKVIEYDELKRMHSLKTGRLISCACLIGYITGKEFQVELYSKLKIIADNIGILFQVVDDIIDVTSSSDILGKTANKDLKNNKATFVTMLGLDEAKEHANNLAVKINKDLDCFPNSVYLKYITEIIHKRNN